MLDLSSKSCTVTGVDVKPPTHYFTGPLTCQFWYAFLIVPQCLLLSLRGSFWVSSGSYSEEPLILTLTKTSQKIHGHILQAFDPSIGNKESLSSVQFSRSVVSDSGPHESQLTRPPCPSPTPKVYSNSCPSSQ